MPDVSSVQVVAGHHFAAQTRLMWNISVGMGLTVLLVVVILCNLLLQSVRALDRRVDQVWSAAVGLFVHTLTVAPQLRTGERHVDAALSSDANAASHRTTSAAR
jgi:hypothetical protein